MTNSEMLTKINERIALFIQEGMIQVLSAKGYNKQQIESELFDAAVITLLG